MSFDINIKHVLSQSNGQVNQKFKIIQLLQKITTTQFVIVVNQCKTILQNLKCNYY